MGVTATRHLAVCMLLPIRYGPDMSVYPGVAIPTYLARFGHHVAWVLSSEEGGSQGYLHQGDIAVHLVPHHHYFPGSSKLANSLNYVPHLFCKWRLLRRIFRERDYDVVFVRDNPDLFDGLMAAYIKKRHSIAFVLQLSNPLEQFEVRYRMWPKKPKLLYGFISKLHAAVNLRLLRQADLVLPVSKWLQNDLVANKKLPEAKSMPLPPGVDMEAHAEPDGGRVIQEHGLQNSQITVYVGTMDKGRDLGMLVRVFDRVRQVRQQAKLLMVGDGDDGENLRRLVRDLRMENDVVFIGRVPQSQVADFIAAADIGVSPVPPDPWFKLSAPIKMLEYMALAKPVVANQEIPDQEEALSQSGGGILVPYSTEAFAAAIVRLLDDPEEAAEMGRNGHTWVKENRSYEVLARQLESRYLELVE